jgi:hypothetical protein
MTAVERLSTALASLRERGKPMSLAPVSHGLEDRVPVVAVGVRDEVERAVHGGDDARLVRPPGLDAVGLQLTAGDQVIRWSRDGRELWVWAYDPCMSVIRVDRVDPESGRRAELLSVVPHDLTGAPSLAWLTLADDPRVYAYVQLRYVSALFTVDGVR